MTTLYLVSLNEGKTLFAPAGSWLRYVEPVAGTSVGKRTLIGNASAGIPNVFGLATSTVKFPGCPPAEMYQMVFKFGASAEFRTGPLIFDSDGATAAPITNVFAPLSPPPTGGGVSPMLVVPQGECGQVVTSDYAARSATLTVSTDVGASTSKSVSLQEQSGLGVFCEVWFPEETATVTVSAQAVFLSAAVDAAQSIVWRNPNPVVALANATMQQKRNLKI